MEQKYVLGILAVALVSVLGVSIVSAHGFGFMNHELSDADQQEMQDQMDAIHEAVANGDYDTWASLMNDRIEQMKSEITEENFNSIVEHYDNMTQIHDLRDELRQAIEDGDNETADSLRTQLEELAPGKGMKVGWGRGHKRGHHEDMPFD